MACKNDEQDEEEEVQALPQQGAAADQREAEREVLGLEFEHSEKQLTPIFMLNFYNRLCQKNMSY